MSPEHEAQDRAALALAREMGAPEGWRCIRLGSGEPTPAEIAKAPRAAKLTRARAALQHAERKTNGQRR